MKTLYLLQISTYAPKKKIEALFEKAPTKQDVMILLKEIEEKSKFPALFKKLGDEVFKLRTSNLMEYDGFRTTKTCIPTGVIEVRPIELRRGSYEH